MEPCSQVNTQFDENNVTETRHSQTQYFKFTHHPRITTQRLTGTSHTVTKNFSNGKSILFLVQFNIFF